MDYYKSTIDNFQSNNPKLKNSFSSSSDVYETYILNILAEKDRLNEAFNKLSQEMNNNPNRINNNNESKKDNYWHKFNKYL